MTDQNTYPIGTPGQAWGDQEKQLWFTRQNVKRTYAQHVLVKIEQLTSDFDVIQYGALPYDPARYPLFVIRNKNWQDRLPTVLVTGGVHGYETSGVQGALRFVETQLSRFTEHFNFIVAPCLSPWGYETINRWNPSAVDPNRSFYANSPSPEAAQLMDYVNELGIDVLAHFDLHETTDTDNSEFRPALAARDGTRHDNWDIPDGFYAVGDTQKPVPGFQKAVIDSVEKVTHIAPPDENGKIIGAPLAQKGVINYAKVELGLCGGFTGADYVTTTEVYPDSPLVDDENCINAQVAAITGGLEYIINLK